MGAITPGAKPWSAARALTATGLFDGSPSTSWRPRGSPLRSPVAATARAAKTPRASRSATGFLVARCETFVRHRRTGGGPCRRPGQKSTGPSSRSIAGTSSTDTRRPAATVTAIPGPKERKKPSVPSIKEATPKATTAPAVNTIGVLRTVERRTASRVGSPSRSASRALVK